MKKVVRALIATTLCLLSATVLSAAILNVPGTYATIQAAIDASMDPSDVIVVAAGTQIEDNILINKPLTIQGGGIGVSFIDASASTATGNVVKIDITSGNVLFDGFTIKTGKSLHGITASSTSSGSTITISHNRIEGYGPTATDEKNYGLIAGYGSLASLVFTYNEITNCGDNTILLEQHVGPTDVSYNTFDRTAGNWSSDAYFCMNHDAADITTLQKVSHNTIDMGAGTVFTNDTRGTGITFASAFTGTNGGFTNIEITDNVIYNLKPYRRGIGFWNNAGGGGGAGNINAPVVARNTILGNAGATGSYGIRLLGLVTNASITDNDCDRLDYGIWVRAWNGGIAAGTAAHRNSLTRCSSYGMLSEALSPDIDAENNWWGAASGPTHLSNPSGTGATVSNYVDFTPWVTAPNAVSVVPSYALTNCTDKRTVTFHIEPGAAMDVRGYEVKFEVNTSVATVASLSDIKQKEFLNSVGATSFYPTGGGSGGGVKTYTVTCAILGGNVGAKVSGDLFTVDFTPVVQGTSAITITSLKVRDINNVVLLSSSVNGSIQVDCSAPTMEDIVEAQNAWYNTAPTFSNFGFDDDLNLDRAEYKIDGGLWTEIISGIDNVEWNSDGWAVPGFAGMSQGSHTVYFRVKDDAGNWNGEGTPQPDLYRWKFRKDTVVPAAPTNFVSMPGNDKTHLTWTNPAGDPTFDKVEVRFNRWNDYPEYGTPGQPEPSYPADHTLGTFVVLTALQAYDVNPLTPRDIYYYSAFTKDSAGNYSVLGPSAKDRTTSYWLGDVTADGQVASLDLVTFSGAFGTISGGAGWNNLCDFGPTDDWSRLGIPLPNNTIDFEDLMIFSMNWGNVTPLGVGPVLASERLSEDLGDLAEFQIVPSGENEISIVLKNRASTLKGIHLVVEISDGELVTIERGSVFGSSSQLFFGTIPSTAGDADVCISALGVEVPLKSSGEIARLVLKPSGESAATVRIKVLDLRNLDNVKYEVVVTEEVEAPFVPNATALMQNFPNPFNPSTTLAFDVAQAGNVTIQVYDVSGRLVVTLLNAHKEIGRHRVEWNGKNASGSLVPSGIYFYRMRAASFEVTKKMLLVR